MADRFADRPAAQQRGFSLLELVIVIILVVVLFLAAFDRLLPLRGAAESAHVATVIGGLRSAIGLESAHRITREGLPALVAMDRINPMELLQDKPARYIGTVDDPNARDIAAGTWYFDESKRAVGYRVRFPQYLETAPGHPVYLHWQTRIQYQDRDDDGSEAPGTDRITGLRLEPLHEFRWEGALHDVTPEN